MGSSAPFFLAWALGGVVSLFGALTYAEIGSRFPRAGGYYKVVAECYHPALAFMLNWAQALMQGRRTDEALAERAGDPVLAAQRTFPGNRPSTTIVLDRLTPRALGALIALYEHITFVEGAVWDINSFDQWGVELGKQQANDLAPAVSGEVEPDTGDASTDSLIGWYRTHRG